MQDERSTRRSRPKRRRPTPLCAEALEKQSAGHAGAIPRQVVDCSSVTARLIRPGLTATRATGDRLLGKHGVPKGSPAGREEFARQMERHRSEEERAVYGSIRRGWCLGREEFRNELLVAAVERMGANRSYQGLGSAYQHSNTQWPGTAGTTWDA